MNGYAGTILRIDLTKFFIKKQPLTIDFARNYLGGTGFCAKILWDEIKERIDPLSEKNIIVFATGPITGTIFPPSGRYVISSLSPLTNIWCESHAGGFFGPELKYAGYDAVVISGKAKEPVYIFINDGNVSIVDAKELWGLDTFETTNKLLEKLGFARVACIGQAGENLVRYACIMNDKYRAAGRGGLGAVMGSKNLKAIAVRGKGSVKVANFNKFMSIAENARKKYTKGKWGIAAQESLGRLGTPALVEAEQEIGRLPTKNHFTGIFKDYESIGSIAIKNRFRRRRKSCFCCAIQCKFLSSIEEGKYKGYSDGPEYETVFAFGSNCLNNNLESIIHANFLCNRYGLDSISTGKAISFAMECEENKLISEGIEWGNEEKIIELIKKIALREGIGKLLAEGTMRAAKKIGKGAKKYAMEVKGMEISGQDGRPHKSCGLVHAISVRGADHLRALSSLDELGYDDVVKERYPKEWKKILELRSESGKGKLIVDMEDLYAIVDSLLICKYGTMWPPIFYFNDFAEIIPALTGFNEYSRVEHVRKVAKRIALLRRAFNARLGIRRKDDCLPKRFTKEKMPSGPAKGEVVNLNLMLNDFYDYRGCRRDGLPKKDVLVKVGLEDVAKELGC
ncbi:MAG: aldehyde ferredoxin oxidoreductase family protein [Candidatus Thermoplasmatota archaeon]